MKHLLINPRVSLRSFQRGVALIEVLIVFFVLGIGLLGMAALQMKSIQYNQSAYIRSQATVAAYDILDRMRVNKAIATGAGYDIAIGTAAPTGSSLADTDLQNWKTFLSTTLPSGDGSISCNSTACTVTISWADRLTTSTTTMKVVSQL